MGDIKNKRQVFFYFTSQEDQKIEILRITAADLMRAENYSHLSPEIREEFGLMIFIVAEVIRINERMATYDQIKQLDCVDYTMIMESINEQLS